MHLIRRRFRPRHWRTLFAIAATLVLAPVPSQAGDLFSSTLLFQTQDQSMWATGDAFVFDYHQEFLSPSFSTGSILIDPGPISGGGITVDPRFAFSATGQMGVATGFYINSGSLDAALGYGVSIGTTTPISIGNFFKFSGTAVLDPSSTLATTSPTIETSLDGVLRISVNDFYEARVSDGNLLNGVTNGTFTSQRDESHGGPRVGVDVRKELFGFNARGTGRLVWKGADVGGVGDVIRIGNPLAPTAVFTVGDWRIDASGGVVHGAVSAHGQTTVLTTVIDADAALVGPVLGPSIDTNLGPNVHLSAGYDVVDFRATLATGYQQQFDLASTVSVVLHFSHNVLVRDAAGNLIETDTVSAASIEDLPEIALLGPSVDVTPVFSVGAHLHNRTDITLDLLLQYQALAGHIALDFSSPFYNDDIYSSTFGPLRSWDSDIDPLDLGVYDEQFVLGGFDSITGATFTVSAVPEPGTFALFGAGVIGVLGWAGRKTLERRAAG